MKDWNSSLRKAYMTLLESTGYNVYYRMAPDTVNPGDNYIILSTITGREDSDKNSYNGVVSVLLDIVTTGNAALNVAESEAMVSAVKALINKPDLSPDFYCATTRLISDDDIVTATQTNKILRRLLRYEHFINQRLFKN